MGQEKEVTVYRLIVENSIDEGMLAIADEKLKLEENLSNTAGTAASGTGSDKNSSVENDVATLLESVIEVQQWTPPYTTDVSVGLESLMFSWKNFKS